MDVQSGEPGYPHVLALEASAGAGKTYALALRYLSLLARSGQPSIAGLGSILALTFTTAAAQEMKDRILAMLKTIALAGPDDRNAASLAKTCGLDRDRAGRWVELILRRYGLLQIKTIDSLHFQLMQSLARSLDLGPDAEVDFSDRDRVDFALESLMARTRWPDDPEAIIRGESPQLEHPDPILADIWADVFRTYLDIEGRRKFGLVNWVRAKSAEVFKLLKNELQDLETDAPDRLREAKSALLEDALAVLTHLETSGLMPHVAYIKPDKVKEYLTDPTNNLDKSFFGKTEAKKIFKKSGHDHVALDSFMESYRELQASADAYLFARGAARLTAFARLHRLLVETLNEASRHGGVIPGGWWTRLLRQRIGTVDIALEAAMILGFSWRHIMIDEFQDTSRDQWDILRELAVNALSEGGSLFYVGDVKQAIYGWRGGDWRLFDLPLKPDQLPNVEADNRVKRSLPFNWRSSPDIVDFANRTFGAVAKADAAESLAGLMLADKAPETDKADLAEDLARVYDFAPQQARRDFPAEIRIIELDDEDKDEFIRSSLDGLTAEVRALREAGTFRYRDMAVLVRQNGDATAASAALLEAGVPTVTEKSLRLDHSPVVRGLLSLLNWLESPEDDLSLYAFCQSGLTPEGRSQALTVLLAGKGQGESALKSADPDYFARVLAPLRKRAGYAGPYAMLVSAVDILGLDHLPDGQRSFVEKLLETAFNAETEGVQSLSGFARHWEKHRDDLTMGLPESLDAVRVMSIHKSKGLEFPAVFIPLPLWPGAKTGRLDMVLARDDDDRLYPVAASAPRCARVEAIHSAKRRDTMIEEFNLLYVAVTRASRRLSVTLRRESAKKAGDWLRLLTQPLSAPDASEEDAPCA